MIPKQEPPVPPNPHRLPQKAGALRINLSRLPSSPTHDTLIRIAPASFFAQYCIIFKHCLYSSGR